MMRTALAIAGAGILSLAACAPATPTLPAGPSATRTTIAVLPATITPFELPEPVATQPQTSTPAATATALPTPTAPPTNTPTPKAVTAKPTLTRTPRPTATLGAPAQSGQTKERGGSVMVAVPAGAFVMGSRDDPYAFRHETPQRAVQLDAYWFDRYEVTNGLYAKCVAAGVCQKPRQARSNTRSDYYTNPQYAEFPVLYVSWLDAKAFCEWSGKRMPTEAEWEKAARGPDGSIYPWGDAYDPARLNSADRGPGDTVAVGSYPDGASVYGVHDLAGNAWEFVADLYDGEAYRLSPLLNPKGPTEGPPPSEATGVLRGGAWNNDRRAVRSANRLNYFQRHVGFETTIRCAADY